MEFSWTIGAVCLGTLICLDFYLIRRLRETSPEEFEKAGKPSPYWSDLRSLKFMIYVLKRKYQVLSDKKLVTLFNIARWLTLGLLVCMALFFISISVTPKEVLK